MPKALSSEKRHLILTTAKRLFASKGFAPTSISDLVRQTGLPVGTIYTYFQNKEEIIRAIVEEGWAGFRERMMDAFQSSQDPKEHVRLLVETFLPELLQDVDLITILLSEGLPYTGLEAKMEELAKIIGSVLKPLASSARGLADFGPGETKAALMVYFLGVLDAVRISESTQVDISATEILAFLRLTIRNGLEIAV